jgi:AcrR family transcriptional regulator
MSRPPTDARERLKRAALTQFAARGFDGTTVADIAAEAGLTERTFYRYFADKREALFTPQSEFNALFLADFATSSDSPDATGRDPRTAVERAILAATVAFPNERREQSRARQRVLEAEVRFQERELLKLATLTSALAAALVERDTEPLIARLAAERGAAVFRVAFDVWVDRDDATTFTDTARTVFADFDRLSRSRDA